MTLHPITEMPTTDWKSYARTLAQAQGISLTAEQLERIAAQLALIADVAAPLLAQRLAAEVEPAPVFQP